MIFQVLGNPQGKARPRFNGQTRRTYTPAKTKNYEADIAWAYKLGGGRLMHGAVEIKIWAYFTPRKSASKKLQLAMLRQAEPVKRKPDIDNIAKIVLDGLNGVAYIDDAQVVSVHAMKLYSETPRLEIEIKNR